MECQVCERQTSGQTIIALEMMFGLRDSFRYLECDGCGCVQLVDAPADMATYYPANYYSFSAAPLGEDRPLVRSLKRRRTRHALGDRNPLGALLLQLRAVPLDMEMLRLVGARVTDRFLDVGCGGGGLLLAMAREGFESLTGVDPFIPETFERGGVRVVKETLAEHRGEYDVIMLHHAFEHMPDPRGTMARMQSLLAPGGRILVRIPVADSQAWRTYRENWVQLDAPRHLFLHTRRSMEVLAEQAGLELVRMDHDSRGFQFWGSEQYRRGIPLMDPASYGADPAASGFTAQEIEGYEREARRLNALGEGDQACFLLRRRGGVQGRVRIEPGVRAAGV